MTLLLAVALAWGAGARPRLTVGLRAPITTLSLYAPATIEGYRVTSLIFEPLARVDRKSGALEPWLATKWTRSGDRVRVELRKNVVFHDGHALEAEDVVNSLAAFRLAKNRAATWLPLWASFEKASVLSPHVVEFRGRGITFENLRNLLTTLRIHRGESGTGPFSGGKVSRPSLFLAANPKWWRRPRPEFDVAFKPVVDLRLARQMLARGELDVFAAPESSDDDLVDAGSGTGFWIDLNLRRKPFDRLEVRRALANLWDRRRLNATMFAGRWRLANDAFDPSLPDYPRGLERKETSSLADLGYGPEHPLEFELLVSEDGQERWATLFQKTLADAGVHMTIRRAAPDGEWWRRLRAGRFDAAAGGGALLTAVDADTWSSQAAYNVTGLADEKLDELLGVQSREFAPRRRAKREVEMIARVREQLPQLPGLVRAHGKYLVSGRVRLEPDNPDDVWRWRLAR